MGYSVKAVTWARRQKPVGCSCGCGVIIMPKPAWYAKRNKPPEVRYIRGHSPQSTDTKPEYQDRPDELILANKTPDSVVVECPRQGCDTRWQVSPKIADYISEDGCSFCAIDDIIADRVAQGIPVYPDDDDLDETDGAVTMSVPTYLFLKAKFAGKTLGEIAAMIKNGTFKAHPLIEAEIRDILETEIRDILDQCGLSEEYI